MLKSALIFVKSIFGPAALGSGDEVAVEAEDRQQGERPMGFWSRLIAPAVTALALGAMQAQAADKLFVYVSPNAIGVNAFLQMGKTGIEAAGKKYGAKVKTYESNTPPERLENVNAA